MKTPQAFDTTPIDQALGELHHAAAGWAAVSLPERIALLERMMPRVTRRPRTWWPRPQSPRATNLPPVDRKEDLII